MKNRPAPQDKQLCTSPGGRHDCTPGPFNSMLAPCLFTSQSAVYQKAKKEGKIKGLNKYYDKFASCNLQDVRTADCCIEMFSAAVASINSVHLKQ